MAYRYPAPTKSGFRYSRRRRWPQWYRIDKLKEGELAGALIEQRVRCGKPTCKCASGSEVDLHGPYTYRVWRDDDGKQRKQYVKRSDLEEVRAAIACRERRLKAEREERKRHMRRGEYSWKAQHPELAAAQAHRGTSGLLQEIRALQRALRALRGGRSR
jgi:hypothetical protein